MSYIRDRYHATEGRIVRLFVRFYRNGALVDPNSFGPINISPESDPTLVLAHFNAPVRYGLGYYYVEWQVPSSVLGSPYYNILFDELVNQRLERNFRDTWTNISIGGSVFTQFGNFYITPEDVEIEFDTQNIMQFQFSLQRESIPKGSQDYMVVEAIELNRKLYPGLSGWPDGQIQVKRGESITRNWESALHQGDSNEYAFRLDTDGMLIGPYFAKLRFEIPDSSTKSAAQVVGIRNLVDGYSPAPGQNQILAVNVDGQHRDIIMSSNATRGEITGVGRSWSSDARVESATPVSEPIITLDGVTVIMTIDGRTISWIFSGISLRVADVTSQINTASLAALGYPIAESFLDGVDTKIRINSKTRSAWTYAETTPPVPPADIAHVKIDSASGSLTEIGFSVGNEGWGSELLATITPNTTNNALRVAVSSSGAPTGDYQVVNFPVGYWSGAELISMMNGVTPFNQAMVMSDRDEPPLYAVSGLEFSIEANLIAGNTGQSTVTFSGNLTMLNVIAEMNVQFTLDGLDVIVDAIPVGPAPGNNRIRIRSNTIGSSSSLEILDGLANSELGFHYLDGSMGADPIVGATAEMRGNRVAIVGDTTGLDSCLHLDSEVNGSTINTLLGFPTGGVGPVCGTDAEPAASVGRWGPLPPLSIDQSTQAFLKSDPLGLVSLGGTNLSLQIDSVLFTINFTEVETQAKITGALILTAVSLSSFYKVYTGTASIGINRRLLSPTCDISTIDISNSNLGVFFAIDEPNMGAIPPASLYSSIVDALTSY